MIKRPWLLLLTPVLLGQTTFPNTQSGPFYRHIITPTVLFPAGCTMTIDGKAAPEQTPIIIESASSAIPFLFTCSFPTGGVTVSSRTTGAITMDFPGETPPNATLSAGLYRLPPGGMRTRVSVAAAYTPVVSVTPTSTYAVELGVAHGLRATGARCFDQTDRRSGPKGEINVAMSATCDHEDIDASLITPPHGFGTPTENRAARIQTVVRLTASERNSTGGAVGPGGSAVLRIDSEYKTSPPVLTPSPATLRLTAAMGKAEAATATLQIANTGGGHLDWNVSGLSDQATGRARLSLNVPNAGTAYATFSPLRADTIGPGQTSRLTVTIDTSEVRVPGTFSGTFTLGQANLANRTVIPIEVVIGSCQPAAAGASKEIRAVRSPAADPCPADTISLSDVDPAPGSALEPNSEQRFSGLARFTLASAVQGTVTLEVADQSGGPPIGRSEAVEIKVAGTFEAPLAIPAFTLPSTVTSLTLKAVLRPAGGMEKESSPPVNYTIAPPDSIRIVGASPEPGKKLVWGTKQSFRARVRVTLQSRSRALVALRIFDQAAAGNLLASSDFITLRNRTSVAGDELPDILEIKDFDVPQPLRAVFLQAVLIDETNPGVLARYSERYPIPEVKLSISSVEVVQVTQTADNRVPLIAGKPGVVRAFVKQEPDSPQITGLSGSALLAGLPLDRLAGPVASHPFPERRNLGHSLNFPFPADRAQEGLHQLRVWFDEPSSEAYSVENDQAKPKQFGVTFEASKIVLWLELMDVDVSPFEVIVTGPPRPPRIEAKDLRRAIDQLFPTLADRIAITQSSNRFPYTAPITDDLSSQARLLNWLKRQRLTVREGEPDMLVAVVEESVNTNELVGLSDPPWRGPNRGRVAFIKADSRDPGRAAIRFAHEVGHNLGLHHPNTNDACKAADAKTNWSKFYTDGAGTVHDPGFDIKKKKVVGPDAPDLMTYCEPATRWISPFHYYQLKLQLESYTSIRQFKALSDISAIPPGSNVNLEAGADAPKSNGSIQSSRSATAADFLVVSGWVGRGGGQGGLDPVLRTRSLTPPDADEPDAPFCIEFHTATTKLSQTCFSLSFEHPENDTPLDRDYFTLKIPANADVARVVLRNGSNVVAELTLGATPTVRIDSPAQGERFEGSLNLAWTGSHPQGKELVYRVDYSRDEGSWTSIALDLPATSMTVTTASFPEPGDYFFRVTATNGLDSVGATVGPISVAQVRRLELPVRSLSFGEISLGQVETRSLRIRGAGTGPVRIGGASFSNALFSLDELLPLTVPAGAESTLTIDFDARTTGLHTGTLRLESDDPDAGAVVITLEATVISGSGGGGGTAGTRLEASPATLDFGSVNSGQTKELTFQLRNIGSSTATIASVTSSNARFSFVRPTATPFNVGGGSFEFVTIRFSPAAGGAQAGTLAISSNDPQAAPLLVPLSGTGVESISVPVIEVTPANLDFGTVTSGQTKDLVLTVRNSGTSTLTVNSLSSSNARFVMVVLSAPFNVGAGLLQNATIRFSPTEAGLQTGTVTIASNDPARPSVTINVSGTGAGGGGGGGSTPDPNVLRVDDGTFELATGFNQGGVPGYFVNRLTPASYPATLRKVIVVFPPSGPPAGGLPLGSAIQLISASTASTGDQLTGLTFTRTNGTVTAFDTFIEYDVPALTIQSGSFVVGFTVLNPPSVFPALLDKSSQSARRSYVSDNGGNFFLVDGIAGVGPGNLGIRARVEYTGNGAGGTASTRVGTTVAAGWPNGRVSNNLPPAAIDGSTATFTWTTESFAGANPSYLGVGFAAATSISRIRLFKDNDSGGLGPIAKNLVIEYTTTPTSTPLSSRVWTPVTGLSNGFQDAELLNATSVNANGTVAADSHSSLASGWASLTFNAVSATGIRIGFSNATPIPFNHYRVYEFEVY